MADKKSVNLLPEYLKTDKNSKFLSSTVDQFIQTPQLERIDGFIGSTITPNYDPTSDFYLKEDLALRKNYSLEPALVFKDQSANVTDVVAYDDIINEITNRGVKTENLDKVFRSKFYSYDPHIDWDKLVNYNQYYWLPNGPNPILIDASLSVDIDIVGQTTYTMPNGVALSNGMKVVFSASVSPADYREVEYYVEGVGKYIKLIAVKLLEINETLVDSNGNLINEIHDETFDSDAFDSYPFDGYKKLPLTPEYITINRSSSDLNPWSRYNRWFHADVIQTTADINKQDVVFSQDAKAKRPIVEFRAGIQLYNFGRVGIENVDVIDTDTVDAFSMVDGTLGYYVDGVLLEQGNLVIFNADADDNVRGKVYKVNYEVSTNPPTLQLVEAPHIIVGEFESVSINSGTNNAGTSWYFDATKGKWIFAQQHTTLNQAPLFDLYDNTGYSYGNKDYINSNFTGSKIFGYDIGTGPNDSVLGFPLKYQNSIGVGSYLFKNYFMTDTISVTTSTSYFITSGVTYFKVDSITTSNVWQSTEEYQIPIIETQIVSTSTSTLPITSIDRPVDVNASVIAYVNDVKVTSTLTVANNLIVNFDTPLLVSDAVVFKITTTSIPNDNGYYEAPLGLTNNPLNGPISDMTLSELSDHVATMVNRMGGFKGVFPGSSNLRDLSNYSKYGTRLIVNSNPVSFVQTFLGKKEHNAVDAIRLAADQYNQFKMNLLRTIVSSDDQSTPADALDAALKEINKTRDSRSPHYRSDMLGYGLDKTIIEYTVNTSTLSYATGAAVGYDNTSLSFISLLVYVNDVQQVEGSDYVFNAVDDGLITFPAPLAIDDTLVIHHYANTRGSFVPATPSKLGLYPKFEPLMYADDSYIGDPVLVIKGHDGSIVRAYGDYRDAIILEFEKRIYNNIKVEYNPAIFNVMATMPGAFREDKFTLLDATDILTKDFIKWTGSYGVDASTNTTFDEGNPFTWNYKGGVDTLLGKTVSGSWRSLYNYFYDTDRPHTHPWEMLGFSVMPAWWDTYYSWTDLTKRSALITAITHGYVEEPSSTVVDLNYARTGFAAIVPVDTLGNLRSPNTFLVSPIAYADKQESWSIGDYGPAETAWRRSSYWPFVSNAVAALLDPCAYSSTMYDVSRTSLNIKGQVTYLEDDLYLNPSKLLIEGYNDAQTAGYGAFVVEKGTQKNLNYLASLKQDLEYIDVNLFHKVGGFVSKDKLQIVIDSIDPVSSAPGAILPPEDYTLLLNVSNPVKSANISGVIVQRSNGKLIVKGYDRTNPYFEIFNPIKTSVSGAITVGGVSESFTEWTGIVNNGNSGLSSIDITSASANTTRYYKQGQLVRYNGKYYRVKIGHNAQSTFDSTLFQVMPSLPMKGGATAELPARYETTVTRIPYGTEYSSIQGVYDLLVGYGAFLESQGFVFDEFNTDLQEIVNWKFTGKEFLYWTTQNWADDNLITLSPFADYLKYKFVDSVVDDISAGKYEYSLLKADGKSFPIDKFNLSREDGICVIKTVDTQEGFFFATLNSVQKEHGMVFNNSTIFNDTIYDIETGYKQRRMKLSGFRTANWNGDFFSPGFVYDNVNVIDWAAHGTYLPGKVVRYNGAYYESNKKIVGDATFDFNKWSKLADKPVSNLLPNFDYKINQFEDFYSLDIDNFDAVQQKLAQHLVGYTPRTYLNNIFTNPVTQYKFYQGYIKEKGTRGAIDKLSKVGKFTRQGSISFNEEWAFRVGHYGSFETYNEIEFSLAEGTSLENPYVVKFIDGPASDSNELINYVTPTNLLITPTDYVASSTFKTYPSTFSDTNIELMTAGYIRADDVTATAYNKNSLLDIANNSSIKEGDTIWLGFLENGGWAVYRYARQTAKVAGVFVSAPGSDITFTTDLHHGLSVGDIISVDRFNDQVNGIHIVTASPALNQFTVASTLTTIVDAELLAYGALFKFENARYSHLEELSQIKDLLKLNEGEKIWVDEGTDNKWQVYEKIKNFSTGISYAPREYPAIQQLGQAIYTTEDSAILLVSAPGWKIPSATSYGSIWVYEKVGSALEKQYDYILNSDGKRYCSTSETTEFGYSLAYDNNKRLFFVGAPGASKVVTANVSTGTVILSTGTGTAKAFSAEGLVKISSRDALLNQEQTEAVLVNPFAATRNTASQSRFGHSLYINQPVASTSTLLLVSAPGSAPSTEIPTVVPVITLTSSTCTVTADYTHPYSGISWSAYSATIVPPTINGIDIVQINQTISYLDPARVDFSMHLNNNSLPQNFFESIKSESGVVLNTADATSVTYTTNYTWWYWNNVGKMIPDGPTPPSTTATVLTVYSLPTYSVNSDYVTATNLTTWYASTSQITPSTINGITISTIYQYQQPATGMVFQVLLDNNSLPQNFFDSVEGTGGNILYTEDAVVRHLADITEWSWSDIPFHMIPDGTAPSSTVTSTIRFLNPVGSGVYTGAGNVYAYLVNTGTLSPTITIHPHGIKVNSHISLTNNSQWGHKIAGDTAGSVIAICAPNHSGTTFTGVVQLFDSNLNWLQNLYSPFDESTPFGDDVAVSPNGTYIFVSSVETKLPGQPYGKVAAYSFNGTATLIQVIDNPLTSSDLKFGYSLSISEDDNTLVISALGTNNSTVLKFDTSTNVGETTFDGDSTHFTAPVPDSGVVYVYNNIGGYFVLADELADVSMSTGSRYGTSVVATNNGIYVGAPSHVSTGTMSQFNKTNVSSSGWRVLREQPDLVDISTVSRVALIDSFNEELSEYLDVIDPLKGKIAGLAEQELKYKAASDPATYSIGVAGTITDNDTSWIDDHVGELWWDLSTAKYVWYEQGDDIFRKNNWGKLFPGASIDVYEWVKSDLMPSEWAAQADTNDGLTKGISGQPKYPDNSVISVKQLFNNVTGSFENVYYFWVKNKVTIPNVKNRRMSGYQVSSIIADPVANGLKFAEILSPSSVAFANVQPMLVGDRIGANIATDNTNSDTPKHTEWLLLAEGASATPPSLLEKKLFDSLLGHDTDGNLVPALNLSYRNRYGIGIRPQQTLFKDRFAALRNVIEFSNSVLLKNRITGNYNFDNNLNKFEEMPGVYSREYDLMVENFADLDNVDAVKFVQAEISCYVADGKIQSVSIANPGYGYTFPPAVSIVSSTISTAEILTEIDNEGKVISVTVSNSGNGYITAPQLIVRPHTVIVQANEEYNKRWTKHVYNYDSLHTWSMSKNQTYDTRMYWKYADWVSDTYSAFKDYKYVIGDTSELSNLSDVGAGDYVKINNIGNTSLGTRYAILEKVDSTKVGNFSTSYNIVYSENGTIQILDSLWNFNNSTFSYDIGTLEETLYDQLPDSELYYILSALKDDIFVGDLKNNRNLFFFAAVKYALTEQKLLDWAFKTSFIDVTNTIGTLDQRSVYKLDNEQSFESYISEVKPYHTQIRNYTSLYESLEKFEGDITDFDLLLDYTYSVGSVIMAEHGAGYTQCPTVTITGGGPRVTKVATAEAYLRSGGVYQIIVTDPGEGYTINPTITIAGGGSYVTTPATASVTLLNSTIRKNLIGMKFDRVSADNEIGITRVTDSFVCSGEQDTFVLTWLAEPNKWNINPTLDGKLIFSTDYTIEYYTEEYNGYSKKYSRFVFLNYVPLIGQSFKITYNKNIALYTAVDRINNLYTATDALSSLMTGIEYPLPIVRGLPFDYSVPWDTIEGYSRYDTTSVWSDLVDYYATAKLIGSVTIDSSVLILNTTTGIVPGQIINILNSSTTRVRADTVVVSVNTGASSITISRPTYSIKSALSTATSVGSIISFKTAEPFNGDFLVGDIVTVSGVTQSGFNGQYAIGAITSDSKFEVTATNILSTTTINLTTTSFATISSILTAINALSEGYPTVEFWKPDFEPGALTTATDGGSWNSLGIAPNNSIIDGDAFLNVSSGYAPEECVAGFTIDSLGIDVYTKADNSYATVFSGAIPIIAGETTTFTVGLPTADAFGIMLHFGGKIFNRAVSSTFTTSTEYFVAGNQIIIPPQPSSGRAGYTLVTAGGTRSVLDSNLVFVQNQTTAVVESLASINDVRQAYVLVDGVEINEVSSPSSYGYMLTFVGADNKRACVKVYNMPLGNHTVEAWFFESKYTKFNRFHEEVFVVGATPQSTFTLQLPPGTIEPVSVQTIVEVGTSGDPTIRRRLTPPWVSYYQLSGGVRTFDIDNKHTHPSGTFNLTNVRVYGNGAVLRPTFDYTITSSNSTITLMPGLLDDGDVIAIMILTDQEYYITGSTLELTSSISNNTVKIISFTDHDNMLIRTERFSGTGARRFELDRATISDDYTWVYVNGIPLTARYDYEILDDSKTIQISDNIPVNNGDAILITTINPFAYSDQILGFRIFKDIFDRQQYKRIAEFYNTVLSQPLLFTDNVIHVVDANKLIPPNPAINRPGVVLINGERIEFFRKDGNLLSELRRSTLGTGPAIVSNIGTKVVDQSQQQNIPYAVDTTFVQKQITTTATTYVITTATTTATGAGITLTPNIAATDQVMVYFGGRQLRKHSIVVHDPAIAYDTTSTSVTTVPPEFTITTSTQELVLNIAEVISTGTQIVIVQKKGQIWTGTESLLTSEVVQANFIRAKEAKLPDIYYYGG